MSNSKLLICVIFAIIVAGITAQNCTNRTDQCLLCGMVDSVNRCVQCNKGQSLDFSRICQACPKDCLHCQYNETTRLQYCVDCVQGKKYNTIEYSCTDSEGKCDPSTCDKCINFYNNTQIINLINVYTPYQDIIRQIESTILTPIEVCSQCKPGYELNEKNQCVLTREPPCPVSLYRDPTTRTCKSCKDVIPNCFQCTFGLHFNGVKQPICQFCLPGFFYDQASNSCPSPPSQRPIATRCPRGCETCSFSNQTLTCQNCTNGYVLDNATKTCVINCSSISNCKKCVDGPLAGLNLTCTDCGKLYYPELGNCKQRQSCSVGNFFDLEKQECLPCALDCETCDIQREKGIKPPCLKCNQNFTTTTTGDCVKGQIPCVDGCQDCSALNDGTTTCTKCLANYELDSVTKQCSLKCPDGCKSCYLTSTRQLLCHDCVGTSLALNSSGLCANTSTVTCNLTAPNYVDLLTTPGECKPCPESCGSCFMDGYVVKCRTCKSQQMRLLASGRCITAENTTNIATCPDFTYNPQSTTCVNCPQENCKTCSSQFCNECAFGYTLINNVCYKREVLTKGCRQGCSECYFEDRLQNQICTSCVNNNEWLFDRSQGTCIRRTCSDRQVFSTQTFGCVNCPKNCLSCSLDIESVSQCFRCQEGYNLKNGICEFSQAQCPNQTLADPEIQQCISCPPGCNACSYLNDTKKIVCQECLSGFRKKSTTSEYCQNSTCLASSQVLGYLKTDSGLRLQCIPCETGCSDCDYDFFEKRLICLACQESYELQKTQVCTPKDVSSFKCAEGELKYTDHTGVVRCANCSTGCKSCFYDNFKRTVLCRECNDSFFLNQASLCQLKNTTQNCSNMANSFFNPETMKCEACSTQTTCLDCFFNTLSVRPKIACLTCPANYTFNQQRCERNCPPFEIMQLDNTGAQACVKCPIPNCETCRNNYLLESVEVQCVSCAKGYFMRSGRCILIDSTCAVGNYAYLIRENSQNWTLQCGVCPRECSECKSTNVYDQKATLNCTACLETSVLNQTTGTCVPKILSETKECEDNQVLAFNKEKTKSECVQCPRNCQECVGVLGEEEGTSQTRCLRCEREYYVDTDSTCKKIRGCDQGQRPQLVSYTDSTLALKLNVTCVKCREGCASCSIIDLRDESTYVCDGCIQNFDLKDGKCQYQVPEGSLNLTQASCGNQTGVYPLLVRLNSGAMTIVCQKCPPGCAACAAKIDAESKTQEPLACSQCTEGFRLNNISRTCEQVCGVRNYFDTQSSKCQACHLSCQTCSGAQAANCLSCARGFTRDPNTQTCVVIDETAKNLCLQSVGTFWDAQLLRCSCQMKTQIYNQTARACQEVYQNRTCGIGEYWGGSSCLPCALMGNQALCSVCTGSTSLDCIRCVSGYFYSREKRSCEKCSDRCTSCPTGANFCEQCEPGSYLFRNGARSALCYSKCPDGTLPYSGSIYQLNPDVFSKEETKEAIQQAQDLRGRVKFDELVKEQRTAIGIGEAMEPLFAEREFSYQVDSLGVPTFQSQKIVVACLPCVYNCFRQCYTGYFWDEDVKMCLFEKCREGYRLNATTKSCDKTNSNTFTIKAIQIYSLDLATNTQPLDKTFFAEALTTLEDASITFQWTLESASNGETELAEVELGVAARLLFQNVDAQSKSLKVPAANLQPGLTYVLQVKSSTGVTLQTKFRVAAAATERQTDGSRQILELGLRPSQMYVTPEKGVSGETKFQAGWDFSGVEAFMRRGTSGDQLAWTFRIIVGDYFKFSSDLLNYQADFVIPPITGTSQKVRVQFIATRGNQRFTTEINIQVTASTATTTGSTENEQLIERARSADLVKALSYQELINVGASLSSGIREQCPTSITDAQRQLLRTQGPCVAGQPNVCCGQGDCIKGQVTRFVCKCKPGFKGSFCEFKEDLEKEASTISALKNVVENLPSGNNLSVEQQNTILNVIKSTAESKIIENDLVEKLIDRLGQLKATTTDFDQLSTYLKALKEVKTQNFRIYQRDQNTNTTRRFLAVVETGFKEREQLLKEQEIASVHAYLSSNLDSRRGDLELEFEFENLKGRASIVKNIVDKHIQSISLRDSTESTVEIQTTISKEVLPTQDEENIIEFISTDSIVSSAQNASQILGARSFEVTIFDASKAERTISQVSGDCPILIQLPVERTGDPKTDVPKSLLNCTYYDEVANKYSTKGLKLLRIDETEKSYIINCCTDHLTSFAAIKLEASVIGTETSSSRLFFSLVIFLISFIISLFF